MAGCGAPHLANGQSAVFDPFGLIAIAGDLPGAWAWVSAARLWFAGLGMYLLARSWGLGAWGRWFLGAVVPVLRIPGLLAPVPGDERRRLDALGLPGDRGDLESTDTATGGAAGPGGRRGADRRSRPDRGARPPGGGGLLGLARLAVRRLPPGRGSPGRSGWPWG